LEVADISGSVKHRSIHQRRQHHFEPRGNGNVALVAGDGVPNQDLVTLPEDDEDEAMATVEESEETTILGLQREGPDWGTIGGLQSWLEGEIAAR
jgi:hypothetical protein